VTHGSTRNETFIKLFFCTSFSECSRVIEIKIKIKLKAVSSSQILFFLLRVLFSVEDPDPEGSETFGRIRIRSGTEINVSDPDSKLDPKKICKKEPYFQSEIRWFHIIIHISHLQVVATIAVQ
jgi:hypothetical protein